MLLNMPHWEVKVLQRALKSQKARDQLLLIEALNIGNGFGDPDASEAARRNLVARSNFPNLPIKKVSTAGWTKNLLN